ncbi:MAG: glycosyltransferase [Gammaproteobacteria bacterium]
MARVLVIGKYYPPCRGGTEANTRDVCEALAERHDVTALVFNHEPGFHIEMRNGVRVIRCAVSMVVKSQPVSLQYWKYLSLQGVDLVHFHAPNFFATVALLVQLWRTSRDVPVIVTHHSDVYGRRLLRALLMPLYHRLTRRARYVAVTSLKNARVSADLPAGAKLAVVPLGIEPDHFAVTGALRAEALVWRRMLCGDAPTIAFIGRHVRYKGLDILVRALAAIPQAHALIAGDGPFRAAAEELTAQLGLVDRVHFLGNVEDAEKLRILAASDVFALPSTEVTEAFGISQLEAMAAGVAVVSSDIPTGVTDLAVHDLTALVVPPKDAEALAAALRRMLGDETLRRRLAERAQAQVRQTFSKPAAMSAVCLLVDKVLH